MTSQVSRTLWKDRYLLFTSPYLFILFAAGFLYLWQRQRLGAIAVALIYSAAIAGGLIRYHKVLDRADWRGIVQTIEAKEQPGDTILWALDQIRPVALNHYYDGSSTIEIESAPPYNSKDGITAMEKWLSRFPTNSGIFWLVCPVPEPHSEIFRTVLEQEFHSTKPASVSWGKWFHATLFSQTSSDKSRIRKTNVAIVVKCCRRCRLGRRHDTRTRLGN
jgi:mannosyltransferase